MRADGWRPTLRCGKALTRERFTISIGELEHDDPFTAILSYDGHDPQPWTRVDVHREIVDLAYSAGNIPVPLVLSNEGDFYTLKENEANWSKIPGAGILSEDSSGLGATNGILVHEQDEYVFGASRQLYNRRGAEPWRTLSADSMQEPGYDAESFTDGIVCQDGSILIASSMQPTIPSGNFLQDRRYREDMSPQEVVALMDLRRNESSPGRHKTRLYRYHNEKFTAVDIPQAIYIRDLYQDPTGTIWIAGADGLLMRGRPGGEFERINLHGDSQTLLSLAWFRGNLIVASDYGLHRFDGHLLSPLKPVLNDPFINRGVPTPSSLQVVDDLLFYFDHKHGVCRWNGTTWDWIDIPPRLLAREFTGLPR